MCMEMYTGKYFDQSLLFLFQFLCTSAHIDSVDATCVVGQCCGHDMVCFKGFKGGTACTTRSQRAQWWTNDGWRARPWRRWWVLYTASKVVARIHRVAVDVHNDGWCQCWWVSHQQHPPCKKREFLLQNGNSSVKRKLKDKFFRSSHFQDRIPFWFTFLVSKIISTQNFYCLSSVFVCLIERATDLLGICFSIHLESLGPLTRKYISTWKPPFRHNIHQSETKELGPLPPHIHQDNLDPTSLLKLCLSDPSLLLQKSYWTTARVLHRMYGHLLSYSTSSLPVATSSPSVQCRDQLNEVFKIYALWWWGPKVRCRKTCGWNGQTEDEIWWRCAVGSRSRQISAPSCLKDVWYKVWPDRCDRRRGLNGGL